ncbi:tyrosine-type recombinase/integrase [Daejeonella lutea]|uniref:Tyrosine recombinase XerC n=1 Tax=Daejeonella lutea TaxID=572036 RepID=A0A1T4ZZ45_9SPHI|nr:tyrosine-type recombinase/integrase [Daejeonella lutea]SKB27956.1 integrase/recombinase XerC [Daejeonella lutea]
MFIERFIRYLQFEKRFSPHTVTAYRQDLTQFNEFLAVDNLDVLTISHRDVRSWMLLMMEQGSEAKTVNRKLSVLRSFYKFLQREELSNTNPMIHIKAPKVPKRLPVVLDEQKMDSLLDAELSFESSFNGMRDRLILELLYGTGIRLSELVNLTDHDVNLYDQYIKVLGKRNKERIIPVAAPLIKLIKEYQREKLSQNFNNKASSLIVTNEGNNAYPQFIYRIVKLNLSQITTQEKKSPHVLRHSFATALLNKGADLNAIKELLGHSSLAATQVYTHNSVEKLKSIYKQAHPKA